MNLSTDRPSLAKDVFVAPSAAVIGSVSLGSKASVWYGCVLKGKCDLDFMRALTLLLHCPQLSIADFQVTKVRSGLATTATCKMAQLYGHLALDLQRVQ